MICWFSNSFRNLFALIRLLAPWLLVLALTGTFSIQTKAQGTSADEYEIRAAMLFNLTKFIDWPAWKIDATHPQFLVCILGPDPIGPDADRYLQNQSVSGKPVQVRHLSSIETAANCHILYASTRQQKNLARAESELVKGGVLTISEQSNTTSLHQVIGLPSLDEHVHIDVNLGEAQRAGLTISSKLLRLATVTR